MNGSQQTAPSDRGPHPGIPALISLGLLVVGIVVSGVMSGGDALASPFASTAEVVARLREHHDAVRVSAFFQLGSAVPLAIASAVVYARMVRFGVRVPGPVIGLSGGLLAVGSLFVSAFSTYVESRPEVTADARLAHALAFLTFASGGFGYVIGLGLLVAGLAVPAYILRLLPRWLAATGLVLAALAELSWFGMLADPVQYLLPVGRFLGGIWFVVACFALPARRPRASDPEQ